MYSIRTIRRSFVLTGLFIACMSTCLFSPRPLHAEVYDIDPVHTQIMFKVRHMSIGFVTGRFTNFRGEITFEEDKISMASAKAKVALVSIDTDNMKRDAHLRSPDFFDVEKYPFLSFESGKVTPKEGKRFTVDGRLTVRGITQPISLEAEYLGAIVDHEGKSRIAFEASGVINRKDYGLLWNQALEAGGWIVGDEVRIILEVQGIKRT